MVLKQSSIADRSEFLISCQGCNRIFRLSPAEVEHSDRIVRIFGMEGLYIYQCVCGSRFNVKFDFRRKTRHTCDISSYYIPLSGSGNGGATGPGHSQYQNRVNSVIKNISLDGIGLLSHRRHEIKPGDTLLVIFVIRRGGQERLLERKVIVRTVRGNYIGAEFSPEDKKKPDIGFFLM